MLKTNDRDRARSSQAIDNRRPETAEDGTGPLGAREEGKKRTIAIEREFPERSSRRPGTGPLTYLLTYLLTYVLALRRNPHIYAEAVLKQRPIRADLTVLRPEIRFPRK